MAMPRTSSAPGRARHVHYLTTTSIDAVELLESDHRHVEAWFADFAHATTMARRQTLAERICRALRIHMRIEEEIFYPAFLAAVGDRPLHDEAEAVHDQAREVIADIEACDAGDDPTFRGLVSALARMVDRHVIDEERPGGMFDAARRSGLDLRELGARLEHRKLELMDDASDRH